jgi:hypothetical protein
VAKLPAPLVTIAVSGSISDTVSITCSSLTLPGVSIALRYAT